MVLLLAYRFYYVGASFSSHGVNIIFREVSEEELLTDYLSVDDFISKFFQVIAMVNPDVTCLSWQMGPPQQQQNDRSGETNLLIFGIVTMKARG